MDVSVRCEVVVAVSQPGLDILHGITQVKHDGGAAMSEVMKADTSKTILVQKLLEFLGDIVGLDKSASVVNTDEVQVAGVVVVAHDLMVAHLLLFQGMEVMVGVLAERKGSHAGLCLGHVVANHHQRVRSMAFLYHRSGDGDGPCVEIDGGPPQTKKFRPTKTVEAGQEDRDSDRVILGQVEQLSHFLDGVRGWAMIFYLGGSVCQVSYVLSDVAMLDGPLQRRTYHGVMLDDGVGAEAGLDLGGVVVLQVTWGQLTQCDPLGIKIWCDVVVQHVDVLVVGGPDHMGFVGLDPRGHMLGEEHVCGADILVALVLLDQLVELGLCFTFVSFFGEIQVDPFLDTLFVGVSEVQYGIVLVVFYL